MAAASSPDPSASGVGTSGNKEFPSGGSAVSSLKPGREGCKRRWSEDSESVAEAETNPYWKAVERMLSGSVTRAKTAFSLNLAINVIIVAVGVTLVASSLLYTWVRGIDVLSTGIAGLGVADFVLIFFVGPQTYIENAVENLIKAQIVYRAWIIEFESVADYDAYQRTKEKGPVRSLDDVQQTMAAYEAVTAQALQQLGLRSQIPTGPKAS